MPHFIEFENVKKVYGSGAAEVRALDGVSFGVDEGEFCVLLVSSGFRRAIFSPDLSSAESSSTR